MVQLKRFLMCLPLYISILVISQAAIGSQPYVDIQKDCVKVINADQIIAASLSDATLKLNTPYGDYRFKVNIAQDNAWTLPSPAKSKPVVKHTANSVSVYINYPVPSGRQFNLTLSAYKGIPGVFVVSKLKVLGSDRSEYYFWEWTDSADSYFVPTSNGTEKKSINTKDWVRFGFYPWVFLPNNQGGLAVLTNGTVGHSTLKDKTAFLHSLPRQQAVGSGESVAVGFGLAGVKSADQAASFKSAATRAKISALQQSKLPVRKVNYGEPAPEWLRRLETYNGLYQPIKEWTSQVTNEKLKYFKLIVGSPQPGKDAIEKCHKEGVKVIAYVAFTPFLDTELEVRGGGRVYEEWLNDPDHESRDLKAHHDWYCYNSKGDIQKDPWGMANNHNGQVATCMHQSALQDVCVREVKLLMEMGYDGIFVDLAWPTFECYGDKFGKHKHFAGKTNNDMYQELLKKVYKQVKSFGKDKIVMQNSGVMPGQWAYCDAQMWESCITGSGTSEKMNEWIELKSLGEAYSDAVRHGKVPVILSYFDAQPMDILREKALYTYAYAHFYGFLWADWFTLYAKDNDFAKQLYSIKLGKPTSGIKSVGPVCYRTFEKGIAVINPTRDNVSAKIPFEESAELNDVGYNRTIIPSNGSIQVDMTMDSGKILLFNY